MDIKTTDKTYVVGTYNRYGVAIVSGSGSRCVDDSGKEYIDLGSGIGVNSLGYCDSGWIGAVTAQLNALQHASNLYYTQPCAALAKTLCQRSGYLKAMFGNSGAEANEAAIKTARKYSFDKYGRGRDVIVTLRNSFHGRTMATLTATGQDVFHNYFFPFNDGFKYADKNIDEIAAIDGVCAVMVEFVQGEGGVIPTDKEFIAQLKQLCDERDILLIADEVQTGIGRTGKLLASEHYGILPDITTLAKGLGAGLPIGAMLVGEKCADTLTFGTHGTTFGGNPVVCAGALEVLGRLDDAALKEVERKGKYIVSKLQGCSGVDGVDGLGMMLGIRLKNKAASDVLKDCIQEGVLVLTAKDKIRLLPPLTISDKDLQEGIDRLISAIAK
ncbi:MAG: acetylornithine/succinylornithine family transaminase [Clostridia bacterium]|nr:acetylornithine/succinylornithine family transaminase [Clostridia bacterium]